MKVAINGAGPALRTALQRWRWEVTETDPDATLTEVGNRIEIRCGATLHADDVQFFPLDEQELKLRISLAKERQGRLAKRLHDLRSPLNAIQGYAEMIVETAAGDALRFASNICTASGSLTARLEKFRDEGV